MVGTEEPPSVRAPKGPSRLAVQGQHTTTETTTEAGGPVIYWP